MPRLSRSEAEAQGLEWYFNEDRAAHVVRFFVKFLRHSKGRFAGRPFKLLPWQQWMIEELFGWVRVDNDTRRFRVAYISTAKKSGKSTILAGLGLYMLVADNENGSECYSAAADREQASIVFKEAASMVRASPSLARVLEVIDSRRTITHRKSSSFWRVLSGDSFRAEGLNIHALLFDELHSQRDRRLWDSLRFGGAARSQPLIVSITTAGHDRTSICFEQYQYAKNVLKDWRFDPQFFAYIHEVDEADDWKAPDNWPKANPSWGVTIDPRDFEADFREASSSITKENAFRRYRLNQWTAQLTAWMNMNAVASCAVPPPGPLEGRKCWVGLDLASTYDTSAMVAVFPWYGEDGEHDGTFDVLCRFWIPGDNSLERERRDGVPYLKWAENPANGLRITDGNVTDYDVVRRDVNEFGRLFNVQKLCVDRWNATQLSTQLQGDGFEVVGFSQGMSSMSAPSKLLENLVASGKIRFGDPPNQPLNWMLSNVSVRSDANGNIKPIKPKPGSPQRIDGVVSLIMALGGFATEAPPDQTPEPSLFFL